jgi:hypothetical protein
VIEGAKSACRMFHSVHVDCLHHEHFLRVLREKNVSDKNTNKDQRTASLMHRCCSDRAALLSALAHTHTRIHECTQNDTPASPLGTAMAGSGRCESGLWAGCVDLEVGRVQHVRTGPRKAREAEPKRLEMYEIGLSLRESFLISLISRNVAFSKNAQDTGTLGRACWVDRNFGSTPPPLIASRHCARRPPRHSSAKRKRESPCSFPGNSCGAAGGAFPWGEAAPTQLVGAITAE